jgi:hypothetical protein
VKTFVLILFVATLPCAAQSTAKYSAKVQLSISCEDDSLKNQFNSFLSRELRSLGDITIVDAKPAILVNLIVVKLSTIKGQSSGFSVAILIYLDYESTTHRLPGPHKRQTRQRLDQND